MSKPASSPSSSETYSKIWPWGTGVAPTCKVVTPLSSASGPPASSLLPHAARTKAEAAAIPVRASRCVRRSEEHTSELQSRFDLVCRLLLEKKNPCENARHQRRDR